MDDINLPKLRILNIRNMPEMNVTAVSADVIVKGIAVEWTEGLILASIFNRKRLGNYGGSGEPSSISVLAVGSLMYRDLCDGGQVYDNSIKNDLQTLRTFSVDYRRDANGNWAPILTHLSTGSTKYNQRPYRDISILEPYWLA